jgi:hypothetical protein
MERQFESAKFDLARKLLVEKVMQLAYTVLLRMIVDALIYACRRS